jgi:hypothetical protein
LARWPRFAFQPAKASGFAVRDPASDEQMPILRDHTMQVYAPSLHHSGSLIRLTRLKKKSQPGDPKSFACRVHYQTSLIPPPTCHLSWVEGPVSSLSNLCVLLWPIARRLQ